MTRMVTKVATRQPTPSSKEINVPLTEYPSARGNPTRTMPKKGNRTRRNNIDVWKASRTFQRQNFFSSSQRSPIQ